MKRRTASAGRRDVGEPHVGERVERARRDSRSRRAAAARCRRSRRTPRRRCGGASACRAVAPRRPNARPAISSRAMSLRISTGRLISASVSRSPSLKAKRRLAERQALEIERADDAVLAAAGGGAQHLHRQRAGGVVGGGERMRGRQPAGDHGDRCGLRRRARAPVTNSEPRPRSMPSDSQITSMPGVAASRRVIVGSASVRSTACGLRLDLLEPHARGGRRLQRDVAARLRRAARCATPRLSASARAMMSSAVRMPRVPACRGAEAVVDQERDRRRSGRGRDRRIPQRTGGGEDHQRREQEPQQGQPPRRARRRVLLRLDVEQQPRRRKLDRAAAAAE